MADHSELFLLFKECYERFDERFDTSQADEAIIIFGVSGAGKSTFLARLKDQASPEQFQKKLNHDEEKIKIADIEIGRTVHSTTLVPEMFRIGDLGIYDVPGFRDSDEKRQIVISILHKILLTRVKKAKFLVILDVREMFADKIGTVVDDYHNKLKELFGEENYPAFVKNLQFVLTNNDNGGYSAKEVEYQIKDKILETVDIENTQLAQFLMRMQKNHLLVDYRVHDGKQLLTELTAMFRKQVEDGNLGVPIPEISNDKINLHENKLNNYCVNACIDMIDELERLQEKNRDDHTLAQTGVQRVANKLQEARQVVADLERDIRTTEEETDRLHHEIEVNKSRVATNAVGIEKANRDIVNYQEGVDFFKEELSKIQNVSLRADIARDVGPSLASYKYVFRSIVGMEMEDFSNSLILVVSAEPQDMTLRGYINNNGSLLPREDLAGLESCNLEIVWYNNRNHVSVEQYLPVADVKYNNKDKVLNVRFESAKRFKVLIYTAVNFDKTPASTKLSHHYSEKLNLAKDELKRLTDEIETSTMLIDAAQQRIESNANKVREDKQLLEHRKVDMESTLASLERQVANATDAIDSAREKVDSKTIGGSSTVTLIQEVGDIFAKNHLKTKLTGRLQTHQERVDAILSDLATYQREISDIASIRNLKAPQPSPTKSPHATRPARPTNSKAPKSAKGSTKASKASKSAKSSRTSRDTVC
eukprot:m.200664 g.200664  ORF g.200664 m.200664 type:complete len:707 (-) comp21132_c0_seq1:188-2308(-)